MLFSWQRATSGAVPQPLTNLARQVLCLWRVCTDLILPCKGGCQQHAEAVRLKSKVSDLAYGNEQISMVHPTNIDCLLCIFRQSPGSRDYSGHNAGAHRMF